ncbi:MAG: UDP-glucose 4-epimerase GalE [Flavobacteriales bacterium]|nr:UDP-glucose 4-epimerase GalE [Flavobacteriales bacterium]|tara:strand:- start:1569 stop:2564 length:996 start_codon:yes stop_codon:yes gene_type:complete
MNERKVIVPGGAGYIGSHTIVELHKSGFTPIIIDNLCNSSEKNIKGISEIIGKDIKWHNVDCTNQKAIDNIFELEDNIEGIIHFAAYKSVEESVQNPKKYYDNNIGSLEVILNSMKKYKVNNIIFSSSCTVYGIPDILPVTENASFKKAESPYAETKQICEKILIENNFSSVSLRYFNPIGSHSSSLIGDYSDDKASNLIPIITETAIGNREKVTVFGNDYNTSDGTCIRDYIHVLDLAKSHVKSMDFLIKNAGKHAFNIGTGIGVSVLQAIRIFEKSNNIKVNYSIGPRRIGDIEQIYANSNLAKVKLNWEAKETIEQAMISAWEWEKKK